METKNCIKCGKIGPTEEFAKDRNVCLECRRQYNKLYREEHKEEIAKQNKLYREEHKEEVSIQKKLYYEENKEEISKRNKQYREEHKEETKQYREEHKEEIAIQKKLYYEENKEEISKRNKEYRQEHKEEISVYNKSYYKEHKEEELKRSKLYQKENRAKVAKQQNEYIKKRLKTDPIFRLRRNISSLINQAIKKNGGSKNGNSITKHLGKSFIEDLKNHLEDQFEPWMTWENWGVYNSETWDDNDPATWKWQLDHILPQSDFEFTSMDDEEFRKCWDINNLRPLRADQNIIDGAKGTRHKK